MKRRVFSAFGSAPRKLGLIQFNCIHFMESWKWNFYFNRSCEWQVGKWYLNHIKTEIDHMRVQLFFKQTSHYLRCTFIEEILIQWMKLWCQRPRWSYHTQCSSSMASDSPIGLHPAQYANSKFQISMRKKKTKQNVLFIQRNGYCYSADQMNER